MLQAKPCVCCVQVGCPLRACCCFTLTSWGRWCLRETPKPLTTRRPTNATTQGSAWAAGACASMHSVLPSTQVSPLAHTRTHTHTDPSSLSIGHETKANAPLPKHRHGHTNSVSCAQSVSFPRSQFGCLPSSHPGQAGGAFLPPLALFLCLPGLRSGHGSGHAVHQPLCGAVSLCHLRGALLLPVHSALLEIGRASCRERV